MSPGLLDWYQPNTELPAPHPVVGTLPSAQLAWKVLGIQPLASVDEGCKILGLGGSQLTLPGTCCCDFVRLTEEVDRYSIKKRVVLKIHAGYKMVRLMPATKWFHPGSNWGSFACEANGLANFPMEPVVSSVQLKDIPIARWGYVDASDLEGIPYVGSVGLGQTDLPPTVTYPLPFPWNSESCSNSCQMHYEKSVSTSHTGPPQAKDCSF